VFSRGWFSPLRGGVSGVLSVRGKEGLGLVGSDDLNGLKGEVVHTELPGQGFHSGHLVLVVPHDEKLDLDPGPLRISDRKTCPPQSVICNLQSAVPLPPCSLAPLQSFGLDALLDALQDGLQISASPIAGVGLLGSPIHGHDQVIQPGAHDLTGYEGIG